MKRLILLFLLVSPITAFSVGFQFGYGYSFFSDASELLESDYGYYGEFVIPFDRLDLSIGFVGQYFGPGEADNYYDEDFKGKYFYYNASLSMNIPFKENLKGYIKGGIGALEMVMQDNSESYRAIGLIYNAGLGIKIGIFEKNNIVFGIDALVDEGSVIYFPQGGIEFVL